MVAADPDPARGEGGVSCDVAVLLEVDAEFAGEGVVSELDGARGASAGEGEVRPGGAIV